MIFRGVDVSLVVMVNVQWKINGFIISQVEVWSGGVDFLTFQVTSHWAMASIYTCI